MATEMMGMGTKSDGIAFLVAAGFVYGIVATACSSPQTAEINASSRSGTLMKWVKLGLVQAVAFVAVAAIFDKQHRVAILIGGGTAAVLLWGQYAHALKSGLASAQPGTEF